jgi:hypothetical protein
LQQATSDFKNSGQYGAYGFSLDQGLQALNRTHAAAGNLASGNADADSMKYATGLAGQQYNNYLTGLQPYLGQQANATAGAAGVATGQGNALNQNYTGQGGALSSNYGALGAGLNSSYGNEGQGANASYMGQGGAANANYTGQGASNAAATMNNYNVGANQLGAIMGVANLAAGAAGGAGGAGGMGGLTGGFGGQGFSVGPTSVGGAPVSGGLFSMFK